MEWIRALAFCQSILCRVARVAAPLSAVLKDNLPAPRLDPPVRSVYVANFAAIGTNAAHVSDVGNAALKEAHGLGVKTHEFSIDSGNFELLGLSFSDTGLLGPGVRRQCKLWQALRGLLGIGHASSRDISFTSFAIVRRELFSVCRAVYVFARRELFHRRRLWPAVRRELLLKTDLSVPWENEVFAVDTCVGGGACYAPVARELVPASGRFTERWRFKAPLSLDVRTLARFSLK